MSTSEVAKASNFFYQNFRDGVRKLFVQIKFCEIFVFALFFEKKGSKTDAGIPGGPHWERNLSCSVHDLTTSTPPI